MEVFLIIRCSGILDNFCGMQLRIAGMRSELPEYQTILVECIKD